MKVVIVNCFDTYEDRVDLLYDYFKNNGNNITVIQSNFRHFKKVVRTESKQDFIFVESKPYYKNMSVSRMTSHYYFAKKAFEIVERLQPDLLYVMIPPNSLSKFAVKYKMKHNDVKLIFDLIDLWPETMPIRKVEALPLFYLWKKMRNDGFKYVDFVITECNLYQEVLKKHLKYVNSEILYLAKKETRIDTCPSLNKDEIHLCYLGSINNIIDISKIKKLINEINKFKIVTLHIIGDGENKENLIHEVKSTGASVKYYGNIYDCKKKQEIFDRCHFGLNIMKNTVCVGLTMKSIDYFQGGLPIINSIQSDTANIVDKFHIGINIIDDNIKETARKVSDFDIDSLLTIRENTKNVFENLFSLDAFNKKIEYIIKEL